MKRKLLLVALIALTAAVVAKRVMAEVGDPCTTDDGRSGYIYASGRDLICKAAEQN